MLKFYSIHLPWRPRFVFFILNYIHFSLHCIRVAPLCGEQWGHGKALVVTWDFVMQHSALSPTSWRSDFTDTLDRRTQICIIYERRLPHMALPFSLDSQETITDPSISPSTDTHHPTLAVHHTAVNCPAAYPQVLRPVQRAPNDPLNGMFNLLASPKHVFSEVSSGTKWRQCCRHCHPWLAYCHPRNPRGS